MYCDIGALDGCYVINRKMALFFFDYQYGLSYHSERKLLLLQDKVNDL